MSKHVHSSNHIALVCLHRVQLVKQWLPDATVGEIDNFIMVTCCTEVFLLK